MEKLRVALLVGAYCLAIVTVKAQDFVMPSQSSIDGPGAGEYRASIATRDEVNSIFTMEERGLQTATGIDQVILDGIVSGETSVFGSSDVGEKQTGLRRLEAAAAAGSGDAALKRGLAVDMGIVPQMDHVSPYQWYEQGSTDSSYADVLKNRVELYEPTGDDDVKRSIDEILILHSESAVGAARDAAKIYGYNWAQAPSDGEASVVWRETLSSGDPVSYADYAKFIAAGGMAVEGGPSASEIARVIGRSELDWGPAFAADYLLSLGMPVTDVVENLEAAHQNGDLHATARLGEFYLSETAPEDQRLAGISLLETAAAAGVPLAYSSLGSYYLQHPNTFPNSTRAEALRLLETGLELGDAGAAVALSRYELENGRPAEAFDLTITGAALGTTPTSAEARAIRDNMCPTDRLYTCETATIAYATSRAVNVAGSEKEFIDIPNGNFDHTYGFAEVLVPMQVPIDDADRGVLRGIGQWVREVIGWRNHPDDQFSGSKVQFSDHTDWLTFVEALQADEQSLPTTEGGAKYLLFVHGFNFSLEDAIAAAARLKLGANLPGLPIVYSWPAGSGIVRSTSRSPLYSGYQTDVTMAARNCEAFQSFVVELADAVGVNNLTIIAHSHGAQLAQSALTSCEGATPETPKIPNGIRHVVYGAPDIDSDLFSRHVSQIVAKAEHVTVYASSADLAMHASASVMRGGQKRVGNGGPGRTVIDGVDTVDVSSLAAYSNSANGHGYLFTMSAVLKDVGDLIRHNTAPKDRCLRALPHGNSGLHYWEFRPACAL